MWGLLISWALLAVAFFLTTQVVPGIRVTGGGSVPYLGAAVAFGLLNAVLGPVLRLATLPLRIFTLGLFAFVLNAILLLVVAHLVPGLSVDGLLTAIVGAFVLSVISALLNALVGPILRAAIT
jgi:putative membrane protein